MQKFLFISYQQLILYCEELWNRGLRPDSPEVLSLAINPMLAIGLEIKVKLLYIVFFFPFTRSYEDKFFLNNYSIGVIFMLQRRSILLLLLLPIY